MTDLLSEKLYKFIAVPSRLARKAAMKLNSMSGGGKVMAMSKLEEWLNNRKSSFLAFRFDAALRTVHRRHIAFEV